MKKRKGKKVVDKEKFVEDWCFCCKDGGELLICDYKECLKAYHCQCVGKDDSFISSAERWSCDWHKCSSCHKASRFRCICCPIAVCNSCASNQHFVQIKGMYGMCTHCLKLALLIEENKDVDSDGEHVDFSGRDTMEGLFKEYYDLKRETLGLNSNVLRLAKSRLSMGRNYPSDSDVDQYDEVGEKHLSSEDDSLDDSGEERQLRKRKRYKGEQSLNRRKGKSSKMEFDGWASKSLIQFLSSIGKNISESLSQQEVTSIINDYVRLHNLHDPKMKKRILCDAYLQSIFGKKVIRKNRIKDLLEAHFYENRDESEESEDLDDEMGCDFEKDTCKGKEKRKREAPKNEREPSVPQSSFAAVVAENIRLVYLTRILINELHKQPESFENKITGCFVRVKAHPHDIYQRNSHLLMQVTGVKQAINDGKKSDAVLLVSEFPGEIPISTISDCDFKEEELEDLTRRVDAGLLKKPTMVELEKKARILHKDITKHWIDKELKLLKNKIDLANEKGWRQQLDEFRKRRNLLQTQSEQDRLLNNIPSVVPAVEKVDSDRDEDNKTDHVESIAHANTLISPRSLPEVGEVKSCCHQDNKTDEVESSAPANTLTSPSSLPGIKGVKSVPDKDDKSNPAKSLNCTGSSLNLPDLVEAKSVCDEDNKIDQGELPAPTNTLTSRRSLPDVDSICSEDNMSKLRELSTPNYAQTSPRSLSDLEELKFALDEDNKTDKGESRNPENIWTTHRSLPDVKNVKSRFDEDNKTYQVPAKTLISPSSLPDVKEGKSNCEKDDKAKLGNLLIPDNAQMVSLNLPDEEEANSGRDKDNKTDKEESPIPKTTLTSHISLPDEIEVRGESPPSNFTQTCNISLREVEDAALLQKKFQQSTSDGGHSMGYCSDVETRLEKTILSTCSTRTKPNLDACFGVVMPNDISVGTTDVIDLSSDDDGEDGRSRILLGEPKYEDPQLPAWHISGLPAKKSKNISHVHAERVERAWPVGKEI